MINVDDPVPHIRGRWYPTSTSRCSRRSYSACSSAITLAATLSIVPSVPLAGMALILGVDRFMSECRSLTNFIGNAVACVIVTIREGRLDRAEFDAALDGKMPSVDQLDPKIAN